MPLMVENHESNRTVFSKSISGSVQTFVWEAQGTPGDLQRVPDALADDVDFLNALDQGCLSLVDGTNPEVVDRIRADAQVVKDRRVQSEERLASKVDRQSSRDILGTQCLGPDLRGTGQCDQTVLISAKSKDEEPPLCQRHKALTNQFALTEQGSRGDQSNPLRKVWVRAEFDAPVRQSMH